ncbi:MAG: S1 RNA-binding domain-containing protein [Oscillospiraceae bacterium]|nr:S1 RNA-binding domain-containing protein [Oscillospiraceae bacterium]
MQLDVGKIYEGKVTGITKFGAFVELEPGTTGMVHISEVASTFVSEIKDHLTEGQTVKVKVLSVSEDGKISLSIKKAVDNPPPRKDFKRGGNGGNNGGRRFDGGNNNKPQQEKAPLTPEAAFEDMLNKFKQSSDERMGDLKKVLDNKRRSPSRRK